MNYVDLPQAVNEIVVVKRAVGVEDKVHHFRVCSIVPLGSLINKTSTINEDQASHL